MTTKLVKVKKDDRRFGLKAGDILKVHPYWIDPSKYTVVCRVSDGYDPECNVYTYEVEDV